MDSLKQEARISLRVADISTSKMDSIFDSLLPKINEDELINVIQFLFDNDKIGKFGNKYQWRSI